MASTIMDSGKAQTQKNPGAASVQRNEEELSSNGPEQAKSTANIKEKRKSLKKISFNDNEIEMNNKMKEQNMEGPDLIVPPGRRKSRKSTKFKDGASRRRSKKSVSVARNSGDETIKSLNNDEEELRRNRKLSRRNSRKSRIKLLSLGSEDLQKDLEEDIGHEERERLELENQMQMEIKNICEIVGSGIVDFALSLCVERFYERKGPNLICHELRDTWIRVMDCQWLDRALGATTDLETAMTKIALEDEHTCLPLNYDTWSRGILELLPNDRRQSVIDPFIRNDAVFFDGAKSTLTSTKFAVENSQSYVSTAHHTDYSSSSSSTSSDDEKDFLPDNNISIFGNIGDSNSNLSRFPSKDSTLLTTLMPRNRSFDSVSSNFSGDAWKQFDTSKWTPSQCDYFRGSGIFRYHNETSEQALARLKKEYCRTDLSSVEQMGSADNVEQLLQELAIDQEMTSFLKDYYDVQKSHTQLKTTTTDDIVKVHELLTDEVSYTTLPHGSYSHMAIHGSNPVLHGIWKDIDDTGHILSDDFQENEDRGLEQKVSERSQHPLSTDGSMESNKKTVRFQTSVQVEIVKPPKDGNSKTQMKKLWALTSDSMRKVFANQSDVDIEVFEINGVEKTEESGTFTPVEPLVESPLPTAL